MLHMTLILGDEMPADLLSGGGTPKTRTAEGAVARFYMRTVEDKAKSAEAGRPIHKSAEYVEIRVPGDRSLVHDVPVQDKHRQRFPREWAAFKAGDREQIVGTPLAMWPRISAPQVEDLKHLKIRTVEELAAVTDAHLQALGTGARMLRDEAAAFLEAAKGTAPIAKMQAALTERDEKIAALQTQMEELKKALDRKGK
jgi:hypothetical protein